MSRNLLLRGSFPPNASDSPRLDNSATLRRESAAGSIPFGGKVLMVRSRSALQFLLSAVFVLLVFCSSPGVFASIFGTVRGIVHDAQHRPIAGARIELSAKQSDWQRSAVSDAEGSFQIDAVPAGIYIL